MSFFMVEYGGWLVVSVACWRAELGLRVREAVALAYESSELFSVEYSWAGRIIMYDNWMRTTT